MEPSNMIDMKEYGDTLGGLLRSSMCKHEEVEYVFEYGDYPVTLLEARCENCDKDIIDTLSLSEISLIESDESMDYESAIGYEEDIKQGLV